MAVQSVGNTSTLDPLAQLLSEIQVASTTPTAIGPIPTDETQISGIGQLVGQLEQLQQANPAAFQQVTSQVASTLGTAATQQNDPRLRELAAEFQRAGQTGQVPAPLQEVQTGTRPARPYAGHTATTSGAFTHIIENAIQQALQGANASADTGAGATTA